MKLRNSHLTLSNCLLLKKLNLWLQAKRSFFASWFSQTELLYSSRLCIRASNELLVDLFLVLPLLLCVRVRVWGAGEVPCLIRWFVSLRIWHAIMRTRAVYLSALCLYTLTNSILVFPQGAQRAHFHSRTADKLVQLVVLIGPSNQQAPLHCKQQSCLLSFLASCFLLMNVWCA